MNDYSLNLNPVVRYLGKSPREFTRTDIIAYVRHAGIKMINFMYPAADGRLKTLNFTINDLKYLETILTTGERVDGSSLFTHIEAGNSDLYVVPRYSTAFVDPTSEIPTLCMLCTYFDKDGKPMAGSPRQTLVAACDRLKDMTGLEFQAMGELEYYVVGTPAEHYPATDQRNYHESSPFANYNTFRTECMLAIASTGAHIKYGHSEVGNFRQGGKVYEQNEIEFLPVYAPDAADQLLIAKWLIRNISVKYGLEVTFAPKITAGKAGSGLHIHMRLMRDGHNVLLDDNRKLTDDARRLIAGMMEMAPSITSWGNVNPTSYLRLVPHQEAPTSICWGDRNRSVLVRVPLGWTAAIDMSAVANPAQNAVKTDTGAKQTIEIRSADCSADPYLLMAALAVAVARGFENPDALRLAADTYVDINIHSDEARDKTSHLRSLPVSCAESADALQRDRAIYETVFTPRLIDAQIKRLRQYDDRDLHTLMKGDAALVQSLVDRHYYCG